MLSRGFGGGGAFALGGWILLFLGLWESGWRRLLAGGLDFTEHFDPHLCDAATGETETFGGADGDVDDTTFDERTTIVDGDDFGFTVGLIDDANFGSHGQGLVSGGVALVAKGLPARGSRARVGLDGIP